MKTFREFLEIAEMQLDENLRRAEYLAQKGTPKERRERRRIMDANAKKAAKEGSTNNLIRSLKPPEPPTPGRVGNRAALPPSGEGLNPERKPPRPRVVTPYVPPEGTENLAARTAKIRPFGTVYEPPAAPIKKQK